MFADAGQVVDREDIHDAILSMSHWGNDDSPVRQVFPRGVAVIT